MDDNNHWSQGEVILYRGIWASEVWWAIPVIVVRDDSDFIVVYWRAGTPVKRPLRRVSPIELVDDPKPILANGEWTDTDILMFAKPGASHSIYAMWETIHSQFTCWYINLQEPLRRTPIGFDTTDHLLDIVVRPDLTSWIWKDEDEFNEAIQLGLFTAEKGIKIRNEGERALDQVRAGQSPFGDDWKNWYPPEDWVIPEFPEGWDIIFP